MVIKFKIKFGEVPKINMEGYAGDFMLGDIFEPIYIEVNGAIINAETKEYVDNTKTYWPWYTKNVSVDFVGAFLNTWLHYIPEILSGKPGEIHSDEREVNLLFHRIDEKNIKMLFSTGSKTKDKDYQGGGKDFIIPIDILIQELIRASKEWIDTRVVCAPKGKEDIDYIAITNAIEKAKQTYEEYKKKHNIKD